MTFSWPIETVLAALREISPLIPPVETDRPKAPKHRKHTYTSGESEGGCLTNLFSRCCWNPFANCCWLSCDNSEYASVRWRSHNVERRLDRFCSYIWLGDNRQKLQGVDFLLARLIPNGCNLRSCYYSRSDHLAFIYTGAVKTENRVFSPIMFRVEIIPRSQDPEQVL